MRPRPSFDRLTADILSERAHDSLPAVTPNRARWAPAVALLLGAATLLSAGVTSSGASAATVQSDASSAAAPSGVPSPSSLSGGSVGVPAPSGRTVAPPASISATCSADVTKVLRTWFASLPKDATVVIKRGACYRVDRGIRLDDPVGLTVYGGTFRSDAVAKGHHGHGKGHAVFDLIGGSHVTLEALRIVGMNAGGYHPRLAFAAGIDVEGTAGVTVRGVTIDHTFGDGITLNPLRGGADHDSGTIVAPVVDAVVRGVTIDGAGRQGIAFVAVNKAQVDDAVIKDPGMDTFDVEADQSNEGAADVTIDGCVATGGTGFFANGGAGGAKETHDITIEHCTMEKPEGGWAVLVQRPSRKGGGTGGLAGTGAAKSARKLRGPINLVADSLWCGASVYVACIQLGGSDVTVSNSLLRFPGGSVHEAVYRLVDGSQARFFDDVVERYGRTGTLSPDSSLHISGGRWTSWADSANKA